MTNIRKLQIKDYKSCVQMLSDEWTFGDRQARTNTRLCGWIYFFDILSCSKNVYVYETNGRVAGLAGFEVYHLKHTILMRFFGLIKNFLFFHPAVKNREGLRHCYEAYKHVPKKFKTKKNCELSIFITHKEHRGEGVGSSLFKHIVSVVKNEKYKRMVISTDDSCNKTYYERHGCDCVLDMYVGDADEGYEKGYIFLKDLQKEAIV